MKMQPVYVLQAYDQNKEEELVDVKKQFISQMQNLYLMASNAVNATIDDISYFSTERATGESWINGKQIYTKTIAVAPLPNAATVAYPHGIVGMTLVIGYSGQAQQAGFPGATAAIVLPYVESTLKANDIEVNVDNTNINIITGANYSAYSGTVTIKYVK